MPYENTRCQLMALLLLASSPLPAHGSSVGQARSEGLIPAKIQMAACVGCSRIAAMGNSPAKAPRHVQLGTMGRGGAGLLGGGPREAQLTEVVDRAVGGDVHAVCSDVVLEEPELSSAVGRRMHPRFVPQRRRIESPGMQAIRLAGEISRKPARERVAKVVSEGRMRPGHVQQSKHASTGAGGRSDAAIPEGRREAREAALVQTVGGDEVGGSGVAMSGGGQYRGTVQLKKGVFGAAQGGDSLVVDTRRGSSAFAEGRWERGSVHPHRATGGFGSGRDTRSPLLDVTGSISGAVKPAAGGALARNVPYCSHTASDPCPPKASKPVASRSNLVPQPLKLRGNRGAYHGSAMDSVCVQSLSDGISPLERVREVGGCKGLDLVADDLLPYPVTSDTMADVTFARFTSQVRVFVVCVCNWCARVCVRAYVHACVLACECMYFRWRETVCVLVRAFVSLCVRMRVCLCKYKSLFACMGG